MNPFNTFNCIGRIPNTDKIRYNFKENASDPTKNFMQGSVSIRRSLKGKDDEYYPEDLIPFKAWGHNATFMHNYINRGDYVAIVGEIRKDNNWEDEDGNMHYGELFLNVDNVRQVGPKSNTEEDTKAELSAEDKKASRAALSNRLKNKRI